MLAVVRALTAYHPTSARFRFGTYDEHKQILLACVSNGRHQGAGFSLTPDAAFDDALLDVCIIDAVPLHTLLRHIPAALHGTHTREPQVTMGRERHIVVDYDVPSLVSTDGEIIATDARSIDVSVLPGVLRIIV
jgi:diacylglycerol kinase family enzyme